MHCSSREAEAVRDSAEDKHHGLGPRPNLVLLSAEPDVALAELDAAAAELVAVVS